MTLTEALVLLFFILALAFAWQVERYRNVPEDGVEAFDAYVQGGGQLPDDWTEIFACVEERVARGDGRACSEALEAANSRVADVANELGIDTTGLSTDSMLDSIKTHVAEAKGIARDAIGDFGMDTTMVDSLSLPEIVNVLRGRGSDPPCWWQFVEGDRDIIYVLEVVLRSQELSLRPIWPDDYDQEARRVPNLVQLSQAGTVTYPQFRRLALPVLRWGQTQNPQCRHFVRIYDSVQGGDEKNDFKNALLTVEDFFYKYLVD
jgi:hypothetical protein